MIVWIVFPLLMAYGLMGLALALFVAQQRSSDYELHWTARALLIPWMYVGLGLDIIVNALFASVVFLEIPREWTLSARVKRHIAHSTGWRFLLASWVCGGFLQPVDRDHCE